MLKLTDLALGEEPKVGEVYMVPCLDLRDTYLGNHPSLNYCKKHFNAIPIIGTVHTDPEFHGAGGETSHVHLDMRFLTDYEFGAWDTTAATSNNGAHVSFPIVPASKEHGINIPKPYLHEKMCFRTLADFRGIQLGWGNDYANFEDEMEKHTIKLDNPICPHHGTPLHGQAIRDGVVTCPLHGANWCAATGKYVRKTNCPVEKPKKPQTFYEALTEHHNRKVTCQT